MNSYPEDIPVSVLSVKKTDSRSSGTGGNEFRRKRKVFFLLDSLNVGGTETQAVELACRLSAYNCEVTLGTLRCEGPLLERVRTCDVSMMEFRPAGGIDSLSGLYQLTRLALFLFRGGFDVVHTHDLWSNLLGVPAARLARVPAVISSRRDLAHLAWYNTRKRAWLGRIHNLSQVVLTNASAIRDALVVEDRFPPRKVRVIHNGIDVEKFSCAVRDRHRLFPGNEQATVIALVGNMHSDIKGHSSLIAAAPAIVREFPQVRFAMIGDGAQRSLFEQKAAQLGVGQNFLFLGARRDIAEILACCDVALLPSRAEGLSNALLEYLASGLPTIASSVGGNPELVKHETTGLLIPPDDPEALVAAVLRLLKNPTLALYLGKMGQTFVAENFSFERLVADTDRLYRELLATRSAS
jgi:L-malate glycosyltransferase